MKRFRSAPYVLIFVPKLLSLLSHVAPIRIRAMTLMLFGVPLVLAKEELPEHTERHESIHVWQQIECAAVGLVLAVVLVPYLGILAVVPALLSIFPLPFVFGLAYAGSYCWNFFVLGMNSNVAYIETHMEREAYSYQYAPGYLTKRRWFSWLRR